MGLLDTMTPAQVYELVSGFLRRVQPEGPAYPKGGRHKKPFPSGPAGLTLAVEAATGGDPPGGPDSPPGDTGPNDPPPDGPHIGPADPGENDNWSIVVQDILGGGGGGGGGQDSSQTVTRADPFNYTDAFDSPFVGPWWTALRGTWAQTGGLLTITAVATGNTRAALLYNPEGFTLGSIDITLNNVTAGKVKYAFARANDDGAGNLNGYAFKLTGNGNVGAFTQIMRIVSGAETQIASVVGSAFVAGDSFGIRATGTTIQIRRNGVTIASVVDATYSSGKLGVGGGDTDPTYRTAVIANV